MRTKDDASGASLEVVVAAAHVNIHTHFQTADGGIHQLPPAADRLFPCAAGKAVSAGLGLRTMPSAGLPRR